MPEKISKGLRYSLNEMQMEEMIWNRIHNKRYNPKEMDQYVEMVKHLLCIECKVGI